MSVNKSLKRNEKSNRQNTLWHSYHLFYDSPLLLCRATRVFSPLVLNIFFPFFYFVCRAATKKVPFWVGSLVLWKNWRKWREAKVKPRLDPLPRIPITLSLLPLVPLQNQGTTKIMNKLRQGQKTRTKIRESKERKIKARVTKTISLVLLRKGLESIAHWRRRTGRRRFLDCLIKTNWTSTPVCSITLISSSYS